MTTNLRRAMQASLHGRTPGARARGLQRTPAERCPKATRATQSTTRRTTSTRRGTDARGVGESNAGGRHTRPRGPRRSGARCRQPTSQTGATSSGGRRRRVHTKPKLRVDNRDRDERLATSQQNANCRSGFGAAARYELDRTRSRKESRIRVARHAAPAHAGMTNGGDPRRQRGADGVAAARSSATENDRPSVTHTGSRARSHAYTRSARNVRVLRDRAALLRASAELNNGPRHRPSEAPNDDIGETKDAVRHRARPAVAATPDLSRARQRERERLNRTPMRRQNVSTVGDIPRTKGAVPRVAQAAVAAAPGHPRARTRVLPRG